MELESNPLNISESQGNPTVPQTYENSFDLSNSQSRNQKKIYLKLDKAQLKVLKESFVMTEYYPKKAQINRLAKELHIEVTKIENWLKYERRKLSKLTFIQKYKKRKRFSDSDLKFLKTAFESNSCPSKAEMEKMAQTIHCSNKNIENWFGNYKKKVKSLNKTPKMALTGVPMTPTVGPRHDNNILSEIKLEETKEPVAPTAGFTASPLLSQPQPQMPLPQKLDLGGEMFALQQGINGLHLGMVDPMSSFFDVLRNYMTSPEIIEMQRKNLALTQNFVIYQQLFQTYLMMNFKKKLEIPGAPKGTDNNLIKREEEAKEQKPEEKNTTTAEQKAELEEKNKLMPAAMQNMINFINNNLRERAEAKK